jgi:hypothetical protein
MNRVCFSSLEKLMFLSSQTLLYTFSKHKHTLLKSDENNLLSRVYAARIT